MNGVQQGPIQSNAERLARLPDVLRGYAKDIEKHGAPLDSGLPEILRFIAGQIASVNHAQALAEVLQGWQDWADGKRAWPKLETNVALANWEGAK